MQVKRRLQINTAVAGLALLVLTIALTLTARNVLRAMEQNLVAEKLMAAQFERLALRTDYMHSASERARLQVKAKNEQVTELLKSAEGMFTDPAAKKAVATMIEGHNSIGEVFRAIVANRGEAAAGRRSPAVAAEVEERLLTQLNILVFESVVLGERLQESSSAALVAALTTGGGAVLVLFLLVGGWIMVNSWSMNRTIAVRLALLRDGAAVIGGGDWDHHIEIAGGGEFTELADAFNEMTAQLRRSYHDLEKEIEERKQTDEALRRSEARWNAAIENFSEGAIIATEDEQVIYWNPAAREMHGFTRPDEGIEPLEETPVTFQLWTLDGNHLLELDEWPMRRIKRGETVRSLELRVRRPDQGWEKVFSYSGTMVETAGGERLIFLSCYDLTDLRAAENAVRESEARLRMQMERMPIGCIVFDERNCVSRLNPAAERIFGYTEGELLGRHAELIVPETSRRQVDDILHRLAEGDMAAHSVNENVTKDGRTIICEWTNTPLRDPDGAFIGFLSMVQDVTEQKQAEEALRRYELLARHSRDIILFMKTDDGRLLEVNSAAVEAYGYPREELLERTIHDLRAVETCQLVPNQMAEAAADGIVFETVHRRSDGSTFPVEVSSQGAVIGGTPMLISVIRDVTERKRAEEALRESESFYRQTLESIPGMVFTTRPDGYCDYQSQQWVDFTGVPMSEHVGDGWNKLLHPDDRPRAYDAWRAAVEGRAPYDLEYRVRRHDGRYEWFKVIGRPICDADGHIVRWFGVAANIDAIKESEMVLKKAYDDLEKLAEEKTQNLREKEVLLKEVHHRVKNNLQVISSLVSLQANAAGGEAARDVLRDVSFRVRSMALVHEKLYQSESLATIDFADYARSLLNYLWRAHGEAAAGIRLTFDMTPLPLAVDTAIPCGLVLNELAGNALKHAFRGRGRGEVNVSLKRDGDGRMALDVCDDGAGLPEDFDWRNPRSLGLRLVQMLATQIKAEVEVQSEGGTRFRVVFPLATIQDGESPNA